MALQHDRGFWSFFERWGVRPKSTFLPLLDSVVPVVIVGDALPVSFPDRPPIWGVNGYSNALAANFGLVELVAGTNAVDVLYGTSSTAFLKFLIQFGSRITSASPFEHNPTIAQPRVGKDRTSLVQSGYITDAESVAFPFNRPPRLPAANMLFPAFTLLPGEVLTLVAAASNTSLNVEIFWSERC